MDFIKLLKRFIPPYKKEVALAKVPLKKIFLPDEIAVFIKTILEVFSRYTTGSIFVVDGGRSLMN